MKVTRDGNRCEVVVDRAVLDLFEDCRVYCDHQYNNGLRRWKIGDRIIFPSNLRLNPYSGYLSGYRMWQCGAYSYAHTSLPIEFSCGRYCSISWDVRTSGWQHPVTAVTTSLVSCNPHVRFVREALRDQEIQDLRLAPTPQRSVPKLGNDVWIGAGVTLMAGVYVADGAIIATGSIVTKDVEPYAIMGGNPARLIRWRFPEDIRMALSEMKWWRYRLRDFSDLDLADTPSFVREFGKRWASLEQWEPPTPLLLNELQRI